jgi:two-component system sensor histidine kinase/response regulator
MTSREADHDMFVLFGINICGWGYYNGKLKCIYSNNSVKIDDDMSALVGVTKYTKLIKSLSNNTKIELDDIKISDTVCKLVISPSGDKIYSMHFPDQSLETKSKFLSNLSHEFRTPMNGILGMTSLLQDTRLNVIQKEYVNLLEEAGYNLIELVNDILDYSKLDNNNFRVDLNQVNIQACIEEAISTISIRAEKKKLSIGYRIAKNVPQYILSDYSRIKQVLINLLSNAVSFSNSGAIFISVVNIEGFIKFSVSDNGIGIIQEDLCKLFISFSQVGNTSHQGTGLGLAICKKIINLLEGDIGVESVYGQGTTFHFTIKHDSNYHITDVEDFSTLEGKQVLVVDDNETNRLYLIAELSKKGMNVISCASSKEALMYSEIKKFDLAVLDIRIPVIGGNELNNILKERYTDLITIGVSSAESLDNINNFNAYMIKPLRSQNLFKTISRLFKKECDIDVQCDADVFSKSKILIVEDIYINQKVLKGYLSNIGLLEENVDIADNGKIALGMIKKRKYDLILLDHKMPVMDGVECFNKIAKEKYRPKVIMVTAIVSSPELYTNLGMEDYILKPIERGDLENKLRANLLH